MSEPTDLDVAIGQRAAGPAVAVNKPSQVLFPRAPRGAMGAPRRGPRVGVNKPSQVLFASLIGTTIEFFDFYIYATAAVLLFPKLFFPASDPASPTLASLA